MSKKSKKTGQIAFLIILVLLLFGINYSWLDAWIVKQFSTQETAVVERVIDGDTIVIENKTSVRLLGINCPERGEKYYDEAKQFLESFILNKTIELEIEKQDTDQYGRLLRYIFIKRGFDEKNINVEVVRNGLANIYYPGDKDRYYKQFKDAWQDCIDKNINLCEKSEHKCAVANCIELKELSVSKQSVTLRNNCIFDCTLTSWTIKDEGRKKFIFPEFILEKNKDVVISVSKNENSKNTEEHLFWIRQDYVWTKTGDTLFLRDEGWKLVLWRSY